ncbi:MAG TPA: hypothetical protein VIZ19_18560 [Roseiarcus sp.]
MEAVVTAKRDKAATPKLLKRTGSTRMQFKRTGVVCEIDVPGLVGGPLGR